MRYETEGMAQLRDTLVNRGKTHEQVDTFKECLALLERCGFTLTKKG